MKVYVYQFLDGEFRYFKEKPKYGDYSQGWVFLGTQEQPDIQPEKKTVLKEIKIDSPTNYLVAHGVSFSTGYNLPYNAKNKRIVYEVEE